MNALSTAKPASKAPKFIERLFERLHADYGTLWLDRFVGLDIENAKLTWAAERGQWSVDEIVYGLSRLPPKFPPGLSEFKALCRPPVEAERAWHEAVAGAAARERGEFGKWSSPVPPQAAAVVLYRDCLCINPGSSKPKLRYIKKASPLCSWLLNLVMPGLAQYGVHAAYSRSTSSPPL